MDRKYIRLPLHQGQYDGDTVFDADATVFDADGLEFCCSYGPVYETQARAAFIVQACNFYDRLVGLYNKLSGLYNKLSAEKVILLEACKAQQAAIEAILQEWDNYEMLAALDCHLYDTAQEMAQQAIAAAEGIEGEQ